MYRTTLVLPHIDCACELAAVILLLSEGDNTAMFQIHKKSFFYAQVTWTFNGSPVSDKRFKEDTTNTATTLKLKDTKRTDTGDYTVTVQNELGSCEKTVHVTVIGTYFQMIFCLYCSTMRWADGPGGSERLGRG